MEHKTEQQNNYGWNLTWNATGKFPIIAKRIWLTKADLEAWVNDTSDTAVEGLITAVYNDGENNGVYFVLSIGDGITDGSVIKLVNSEEGKGLSANNFTDEYKRILDSYDPESGKYDDTALWTEINKKVDKVDGKQLSTEDFTTLLKQKLEGLSNYDDSEVTQAVLKLRTDLDTLVSGDTTTAIKTFNEVIAFLDGLEDTEDLASIIASIEQQIASKQDTIADIATIREGAAKGATALQLEQYKGTVTSVTAGEGLEGGTITGEGTISLASLHSGKSLSLTIPPTTNVVVGSSLALNSSEVSTSIYPRTISADKYGRITSTGSSSSATTTVKKITVNGATTTKAGFMTAADKTKLDGIDMSTKQDVISDLATIREGAALGATALQSYTEQYKGTVTGIKVNGETNNPTDGVVDLGTVITEHQDLSGKQDKLVSGTNIKTINGQDVLGEGDIVIEGGNSEANVGAVDIEESADEIGTTYLTTSPLVLTDTEKALIKENIGIEDIPQYAGGTNVTLNGKSYSEKEVSFYAPTSAGIKGLFLMSNGSGSPYWEDIGCVEYDIKVTNTSNLTALTRRYFKYITLTDVVLTHEKLYNTDDTRDSLTKIINMDSVEHSITIVKEDGTALTIVNHTSLKPKKQYLISIMCDIAIMIEIGDETRLLNKFNSSQSGSTVTVTAEHAVASDVTVSVRTDVAPYATKVVVSSGNTTGTSYVSGGGTCYNDIRVTPTHDDLYYYY